MIELQEQIVADRKLIYELTLLRNREGLSSTSDTVKENKDEKKETKEDGN